MRLAISAELSIHVLNSVLILYLTYLIVQSYDAVLSTYDKNGAVSKITIIIVYLSVKQDTGR